MTNYSWDILSLLKNKFEFIKYLGLKTWNNKKSHRWACESVFHNYLENSINDS